jgi:hypothetical protein
MRRPARRELHGRSTGGRARDAARDASRRHCHRGCLGPAGEMTFLRRFWDAAVAVDASAAARDEGRCMPFCAPDELDGVWSAAGLADVSVSAVVVAGRYAGFDDPWGPLERGIGPSGAYATALPVDQRAGPQARVPAASRRRGRTVSADRGRMDRHRPSSLTRPPLSRPNNWVDATRAPGRERVAHSPTGADDWGGQAAACSAQSR